MLNSLLRFSLNQRIFILALAIGVSLYGFLVIRNMPVDVFPDLNKPTVSIMTEAHGMAPEEVETLVTLPLENTLNGLPGVERIRSTSGVGLSIIYVEFKWNSDIYLNRQLIVEKLQQAKQLLPQDIQPVLAPVSSIMGEIQLIGLSLNDQNLSAQSSSDQIDQKMQELRTYADWVLRPELQAIQGVAQVIAIGGGVKEYQIQLKSEKILKYQLEISQIVSQLEKINLNTTGGFINQNQQEYLIRNIAQIKNLNEIKETVVGQHLGQSVKLMDIADIKIANQLKRGDASVNKSKSVILSIQKQPEVSTLELSAKIKEVLARHIKNTENKFKINPDLFNQAHFINSSISNVTEALRDGTILVFIVLILFLMNIRTTFISLVAIPLSFLMTAIVFHYLNLSVNTMTLGGLAIAIGELVDDAIVDVENVYRRLQ